MKNFWRNIVLGPALALTIGGGAEELFRHELEWRSDLNKRVTRIETKVDILLSAMPAAQPSKPVAQNDNEPPKWKN